MSAPKGPPRDDPPFQVLDRRQVFANSRFEVHADRLADGQGREVPDFLVVTPHARSREGFAGAMVLPLVEGRILLMPVYRHTIGRWILEIPGGFVTPEEPALASARRELQEESGLICAADDWISLGAYAPSPGLAAARIALFAALDCRPGDHKPVGELGLLTEGRCFTAREFRALEESGEAQDPGTLLAFHRLMAREERGRVLVE